MCASKRRFGSSIYGVIFAGLLAGLAVAGCDQINPSRGVTFSQATKQFIQSCKSLFLNPPVIAKVDNSLWIYIPLEMRLLADELTPPEDEPADKSDEKPAYSTNMKVHYIDGSFFENVFRVTYDISSLGVAPEPDREPVYTEQFAALEANVLEAFLEAYYPVGIVPGDVRYADEDKDKTHHNLVTGHVITDKVPPIVSIVYADIRTGVHVQTIFHFDDLVDTLMSPPRLSQEEFIRRYFTEIRRDEKYIEDYEGKQVPYREITMPEFIMRRFKVSVNHHYRSNEIPHNDDTKNRLIHLLLRILYEYDFKTFEAVEMTNLHAFDYTRVSLDRLLDAMEELERRESQQNINVRGSGKL